MNEYTVVTVIVPSYNHAHFINETLDSILSQKGDFLIDIMVVDGASKDGTVEKLKSKQAELSVGNSFESKGLNFFTPKEVSCKGVSFRWISEKDSGQASAVNKGFSMSKGDIMCWLNSDDTYASPNTLRFVTDFFKNNPEAKFVYGRGYTMNKEGKIVGEEKYVVDLQSEKISEVDFILQPSSFWRKEIFTEFGYLNENYHFVLDWDYWVRIDKKYPLHFMNEILACNRIYGETKTSSGHMKRYLEMITFLAKNDTLTEKFFATYVVEPLMNQEFYGMHRSVRVNYLFYKTVKEDGYPRAIYELIERICRRMYKITFGKILKT
jgi:glycosyltransferase involved in cell wall biosynthesis